MADDVPKWLQENSKQPLESLDALPAVQLPKQRHEELPKWLREQVLKQEREQAQALQAQRRAMAAQAASQKPPVSHERPKASPSPQPASSSSAKMEAKPAASASPQLKDTTSASPNTKKTDPPLSLEERAARLKAFCAEMDTKPTPEERLRALRGPPPKPVSREELIARLAKLTDGRTPLATPLSQASNPAHMTSVPETADDIVSQAMAELSLELGRPLSAATTPSSAQKTEEKVDATTLDDDVVELSQMAVVSAADQQEARAALMDARALNAQTSRTSSCSDMTSSDDVTDSVGDDDDLCLLDDVDLGDVFRAIENLQQQRRELKTPQRQQTQKDDVISQSEIDDVIAAALRLPDEDK